jgi:hypothetical protein
VTVPAVITATAKTAEAALLLSPNERALLEGNHDFSNRKQRYLRYHIRKKLNVAAQQCRSERREDSLVRIAPQQAGGIYHDNEIEEEKWAESDSNQRSSPCQGSREKTMLMVIIIMVAWARSPNLLRLLLVIIAPRVTCSNHVRPTNTKIMAGIVGSNPTPLLQ